MRCQVLYKCLFLKLKRPVDLKFFSIIEEILTPSFFTSRFSKFTDVLSTCNGETAIGKGSRFPLVISTLINALELEIKFKKLTK